MCSSGSIFPVNLVNAGSFNPVSMMVPLMLGEKGASPANSVLVPLRVCTVTLAKRVSTCRRKAALASGWGAGSAASPVATSWRICCPVTGSLFLRTGGVWV
ncbi:hypothetical protein LIER_19075 [Lithospermum erythrorhizon]|uniref:Uncharacterized protein n=1 Tax=Lithospermum erythrorhizon TaxID=34254 RepID=A0AAV3QJA8_LITER